MKREQLAQRIGDIDDRLVQEAGQLQRTRRGYRDVLRKFAAAAAVMALMLCSGVVGAVSFSRETVVEVPVERETAVLDQIGLSLILPDSWRGRYAVEENEFGEYRIYAPDIRAAVEAESGFAGDGGLLFYIRLWEEPLTKAQVDSGGAWSFARCEYIMTTKDGTYLLYYASDVQFTPETEAEYRQMESQIEEIRFVPHHVLA